ncbi:hypothetical protein Dsin_012713 [Dipteronia sinensis]|uniref:Uncharacterized protein n=1 Tax=Dipteronia sinensis TaxID=43782 RepID=A0AAE0AIK8_9ROSI|nr:hypothetical protein Dsin_012713 [Dipteronia sinensis]
MNIRAPIERQMSVSSPRAEVGEIDTRAPFQSVKAAVSLFGEVAISKDRPLRRTRLSSENVIDRETQLLLAQKEVERSKQQLESAETTKARALHDLDKAKRTVQDLSDRLKAVTESKQSAIEAAEIVKQQAKHLEQAKSKKSMDGALVRKLELDHEREQYMTIASELDSEKQELNKIRQDFDATLEAKQAAFQQAAEAQRLGKLSSERVSQLHKEIAAMKEAIIQLKVASQHALEEQTKMFSEKETLQLSYRTAKEAAEQKLIDLKKEYDPEFTTSLELKLAETTLEVEDLQRQMKQAHAAEMDTVRVVTTELNEATRTLQQVADEECSLRNLVSSLRLELEDVKRESAEMEDKISLAKKEMDNSILHKFLSETETAKREADEMQRNTGNSRKDTEISQLKKVEAEKSLQLILSQLEEAKAAERRAIDELNILSMNPDSGAKIQITKEEFESLKTKAEDSGNMAEKKLADAKSQLENIYVTKNEADKKLEAGLKAIEEIKTATEMALKSADMAAAAQTMVEGELRRWRQQEQTV